MRARALFSLAGALIAAIVLVSASGAGTMKVQRAAKVDVSTRASVVHYLRSVHVSTKGLVIQRGAHNYAGARCPGKAWACAKTRHTVVQIAKRGGVNRYACSTARCTVVQFAGTSHGVYLAGRRLQSTPAAIPNNTAKCIINTSAQIQLQVCVIVQVSSTANNVAVVYEHANGPSGLTQIASINASITQRASGASNSNTACVNQGIAMTGSTAVSRGSVSVALNAHENATIKQDSAHGGNSASQSATSGGACSAGPLSQTQTETSSAKGPASITQNENAASNGANVTIDIEQNQSTGFLGSAHGANSANFEQDNTLTAIANTPAGPVNQTQSSATGGLLGTVNQDSRDPSTIVATQHETQCEDAATSGLTSCATGAGEADFNGTYALHQTQIGPEGIWKKAAKHGRNRVPYSVHKGVGTATQTGNGADTFQVTQSSKQDNDTGGSGQTNDVKGDCNTSGNCNIAQQTNVDGNQTTNTQSGQNLTSGITCTGSACQPTVPPAPSIDTFPPNPSNSTSAEFTFSDTQAGVTFLCQLDNSGFSPCASPQDYSNLSNGSHTFSVEAKDQNGNIGDATSYSWTIDTAQFTQNGSQLTATNVDMAEFGYGGMRADTATDATGDGTGSITVNGISGTVLKALLYWNGPTNESDPNSNAYVSFADTPVTGTNIGTASSNCWSYANSQSYTADVTGLVHGNGTYDLADFVKQDGDTVTSDINGVALVVFYDDGNANNDRDVVLWAGNDSNEPFGNDPAGWDETLTGVPGSSTDGSLDLVVSDGQSFDDGAVVVNGTTIAAAGGIFQGASTPAGPADANGDLWDVESFDLPASLLASSSNTLDLTSPLAGDCLSLVAAAANVPASAPAIP